MKTIATLLFLTVFCHVSFATDGFLPEFSTAGFYCIPKTGREVYSMNIAWRFHKGEVGGEPYSLSFDDSSWDCVSLPNGIEYLPVNASGTGNYQGVVWYRKHFTPEESLKGKKLFLHFEVIMGKSKVWVNGRQLTEHFGGIYRDCWLIAHNDIYITDPNYEDEVAGGGTLYYV